MTIRAVLVFVAMAALAISLQADVLKLKSGATVPGTLISANSREIVFLGPDGAPKTYPIADVSGLDFTPLPAPPAAQPAAQAPRPAAAAPTVPTGTQITSVRWTQSTARLPIPAPAGRGASPRAGVMAGWDASRGAGSATGLA